MKIESSDTLDIMVKELDIEKFDKVRECDIPDISLLALKNWACSLPGINKEAINHAENKTTILSIVSEYNVELARTYINEVNMNTIKEKEKDRLNMNS